jgi:hypothetical protein
MAKTTAIKVSLKDKLKSKGLKMVIDIPFNLLLTLFKLAGLKEQAQKLQQYESTLSVATFIFVLVVIGRGPIGFIIGILRDIGNLGLLGYCTTQYLEYGAYVVVFMPIIYAYTKYKSKGEGASKLGLILASAYTIMAFMVGKVVLFSLLAIALIVAKLVLMNKAADLSNYIRENKDILEKNEVVKEILQTTGVSVETVDATLERVADKVEEYTPEPVIVDDSSPNMDEVVANKVGGETSTIF